MSQGDKLERKVRKVSQSATGIAKKVRQFYDIVRRILESLIEQ